MGDMYDLHTHTSFSDGTHSPRKLIALARELGLPGIGITDHDTVSGWEEAIRAGEEYGVKVVLGVEISSAWKGKDIHILGYCMRANDQTFLGKLDELRNARDRRNMEIVLRLNQLGIDISMEEVKKIKKANHGNIGRPHIAEVLIQKGIVSSVEEAFRLYLGREGAAYIQVPRITPHQAISMILASGGVPVLAHPGLYEEDQLIEELVSIGLMGIEAGHADHSRDDEIKYREIGKQYKLIITAGSDYHGERNGLVFHASLGSHGVSLSVVEEIEERAAELQRKR